MRNDLWAACVHCALRMPARIVRCPRCRGATRRPDEALAELDRASVLSARVGRPLRDAFLFGPVVLAALACVSCGVGLAVAGAQAFDASVGEAIAGAVIGFSAGLAAAVPFVVFMWGAWALAVLPLGWIFGGGGSSERPDRRLRPAPWPSAAMAEPPHPWLPRAPTWAKRQGRTAALAVVALVAVEVGAWMLSGARSDPASAGGGLPGVVVLQLVAVGAAVIPVGLGAWWMLWMADRARLAVHLLRAKAAASAAASDVVPEHLRRGRQSVAGHASGESGTPLLAPLSGQPCLAFRVTGEIDGVPIDDAEMAPMAIVADGGERVPIRADCIALDVPRTAPTSLPIDDAARARLTALLRARHLPERLLARWPGMQAALGEVLVHEGDAVQAWGAVQLEDVAAGGYRETRQARTLVDREGEPVVVELGSPQRAGDGAPGIVSRVMPPR